MANDTTLNPGAGGDIIATEELGGHKFQKVKLALGVAGSDDGTAGKTNPVPAYYPAVTPTDISGTITTGGIAQVLSASNTSRKGWLVRNNHATESLYISDVTTAVIGNASLEVKAGEMYVSEVHGCSSNAISIIAATTGHGFTSRSW